MKGSSYISAEFLPNIMWLPKSYSLATTTTHTHATFIAREGISRI